MAYPFFRKIMGTPPGFLSIRKTKIILKIHENTKSKKFSDAWADAWAKMILNQAIINQKWNKNDKIINQKWNKIDTKKKVFWVNFFHKGVVCINTMAY